MESLPETKELSFDDEKKQARGYGITAAICAFIFALSFIPHFPLKAIPFLAFFVLVGTGWKFIFHGSTAISMTLQGTKRKWFQIFTSLLVPILFSIYFIKDVQSISIEGVSEYILQTWPWLCFSSGIIAFISWFVAKYLDRTYPFRGFLITSTVFFVLLFCCRHGIPLGNSDDAYGDNESVNTEVLNATESKDGQADLIKSKKQTYLFESQAEYDRHLELVKKGHYLYMYLLYVSTSHTAMFLGLRWKRSAIKTTYP